MDTNNEFIKFNNSNINFIKKMKKEMRYINRGLDKEEFTELNMDTHHEKEGLHVWITSWLKTGKIKEKKPEIVMDFNSIHLTREQCRQLRDEINERLF